MNEPTKPAPRLGEPLWCADCQSYHPIGLHAPEPKPRPLIYDPENYPEDALIGAEPATPQPEPKPTDIPSIVDEPRQRGCAEGNETIGYLAAEISRLRSELERESMRLVACGVVALADTPESAKEARQMHPDFESASCDDVKRRVDECIELRAKLLANDSDSTIASCNCFTKTPEYQHHKAGCKYRLICERNDARAQLATEQAEAYKESKRADEALHQLAAIRPLALQCAEWHLGDTDECGEVARKLHSLL